MRKYDKTTGYFVYAHVLPNGMYYIGMSKMQPRERWQPSLYKTRNSLAPYIEQYGWENIQHKVIIDGLTKKEAEQWEDKFIVALSMNGICINKQRSGGIKRDDIKGYMKHWNEDHKEERKAYKKQYNEYNKEERKAYKKQWDEDNKEECKAYKKQYNEDHKEEIKAYHKQILSTPEGKIYNRVKNYNRNHTPIETPMEAKQKYLQWGYIPTYIKNDDL